MSGDQIFTSQPHGSHLLSLFLLPTGITSYTSHVLQPLTEWSPFLYSSGSVCILTFSIHPCLNCSNILAHVPVPIFIHTEPEYLLKCKFCLVLPLPEILNDSPGHARKKKKRTHGVLPEQVFLPRNSPPTMDTSIPQPHQLPHLSLSLSS